METRTITKNIIPFNRQADNFLYVDANDMNILLKCHDAEIKNIFVVFIFWDLENQDKKTACPLLANIETQGYRFINCWKAFCIRVIQFREASFLTFNELQNRDI